MADFNKAVDHVLKIEGGYVHHTLDRGGHTNYGITQRTLDRYRDLDRTGTLHVKDLTPFEAREIYKDLYWDRMQLTKVIDQGVAYMLFDQGVNCGIMTATRRAQEALNEITRGEILRRDGYLGPKTLKAINEAPKDALKRTYIKLTYMHYATIVSYDHSQAVFIRGWVSRANRLLELI